MAQSMTPRGRAVRTLIAALAVMGAAVAIVSWHVAPSASSRRDRPSAGRLVAVRQHPAGRPLRGGRVLRPLPCRDCRELSPPPDGPLARTGRRGEIPGLVEAADGRTLFEAEGLDTRSSAATVASFIARRAASFGRVVARNEAEVKFVLGSGNQGASFLIDRDGFLFQSPISWYARPGRWDLSSGYRGATPTSTGL